MWELNDYTNGKNKGYLTLTLTLTLNGRKVCDAFPYAREADAK